MRIFCIDDYPYDPDEEPRLHTAFLRGYEEGIGGAGSGSCPFNPYEEGDRASAWIDGCVAAMVRLQ